MNISSGKDVPDRAVQVKVVEHEEGPRPDQRGRGPEPFFKKYSQMKREALEKINRRANEMSLNPATDSATAMIQ